MEPTGNGIGGDLFILYYEARTGTVHALNSSGWTPTGLTVDFLASKGFTKMPQRGIYAVTASDLAEFQPEWATPIKTSYRGWNVYEVGPNTQGISALMMLNLMDRIRSPSTASTAPARCT